MQIREVEIYDVYSNGDEYLVLLKEKEGKERYLPMVIGAFEANSILMVLEEAYPDRPFTYDSFTAILKGMDVLVEQLVIHSLEEGIFRAMLTVGIPGRPSVQYDVRPSDGIALSLRFGAPVFVNEDVLANVTEDPFMQSLLDSFSAGEWEGEDIEEEFETWDEAMDYDRLPAGEPSQIESLTEQLKEAVEAERYEDAAEIRDRINRMRNAAGN